MARNSSESVDASSPLLSEKSRFFGARPKARDGSMPLPQTVAHRGYKKIYPENTLAAFQGAVDVGSHGIETDLQLSKDGLVIISHDPTLKRCFGIDKKIIDCDWDFLSTVRTLREPHEKLLRLSDLLEFMNSPGAQHIWVLFDIKANNDARTMMAKIAETVKSVPAAAGSRPWNERIVLGCWAASYFPLCDEFLPSFPAALICFNILSARHVLRTVPDVSFNALIKTLQGPLGYRFIEDAHAQNRLVFAWTVNQPRDMRWSIRKNIDAVLTDDPAQFRKICDGWDAVTDQSLAKADRFTFMEHVRLVLIALLVLCLGWAFKLRYGRPQRLIVENNPARLQMKQGYPRP